MRLFIAINLSDAMKDSLINTQNALYDLGVRGKYTSEENLHLTLAFIGEYPNAEPVLDALSSVSFRPFELSLEGMGRFGDLWWAGMRDSVPLTAVVRRIRRTLAESGIPFDCRLVAAYDSGHHQQQCEVDPSLVAVVEVFLSEMVLEDVHLC